MVTKWAGIQKVNFDHITGINCADWIQTTGNSDTMWTSAIGTPRTTIPIDSLFLRVSSTSIAKLSAKVLYSSSRPCCDVVRTITTQLVSNVTSIFYFLPSSPSNSKMKLQVASVEIDSSSTSSHGELGIFRNYVVSGIKFRWEVDSVGNGLFEKSTSIAGNSQSTICEAGTKKCCYQKFNSLNQLNLHNSISPGNECGYFSLKGEKVPSCLRSGIFVKQ